jgi:hypothetical protein
MYNCPKFIWVPLSNKFKKSAWLHASKISTVVLWGNVGNAV